MDQLIFLYLTQWTSELSSFLLYSFIKPDEYFQNYFNDNETSKTKDNQNEIIIETPNIIMKLQVLP